MAREVPSLWGQGTVPAAGETQQQPRTQGLPRPQGAGEAAGTAAPALAETRRALPEERQLPCLPRKPGRSRSQPCWAPERGVVKRARRPAQLRPGPLPPPAPHSPAPPARPDSAGRCSLPRRPQGPPPERGRRAGAGRAPPPPPPWRRAGPRRRPAMTNVWRWPRPARWWTGAAANGGARAAVGARSRGPAPAAPCGSRWRGHGCTEGAFAGERPAGLILHYIAAPVSAVPCWLLLHFCAFMRFVQSLDSSGCSKVVFKSDYEVCDEVCESILDYGGRKILFPVRHFTCKFFS